MSVTVILYNALLKAAGKVYDTVEMERILQMMAEQVLYSVRNHAWLRFAYIFDMFMRAGYGCVLRVVHCGGRQSNGE